LPAEAENNFSWQSVLKRATHKNCATFTASITDKNKIFLKYTYNVKKCKTPPSIISLTRIGWGVTDLSSLLKIVKNDKSTFEAAGTDSIDKTGRYRYRLKTMLTAQGANKLLPVLMVKDYLSFAIKLLLAFGLIFELPVLLIFLALAGIVDYVQLLKFSRWFIVFSVVIAAILTPPDVITQIMLAVPLIVLYFLSVLVIFIISKKSDSD
jgi:hypothetical protein